MVPVYYTYIGDQTDTCALCATYILYIGGFIILLLGNALALHLIKLPFYVIDKIAYED